jgi:hypothetical protein
MSITAALAIAQATGLSGWIIDKLKGSDSGAAKLAGKVIEFASDATGNSSTTKAIERLQNDPVKRKAFKDKVLSNEHELKKLAFEDRKSARNMYQVHHSQADQIAERIMKWNLVAILMLVVIQGLSYHFLKDQTELLMAVTSIISMAIKSLFDERKDVTGFFFGSSMGSKNKDISRKLTGSD